MKQKKILPLISAIALFSGPALLVAACTSEITRYEAALSNDLQDRILFDFIGVNYSVNAKSQFSSAFKQGMNFIKKEVEGIMAQQQFYNFFRENLNYTEDEANTAFESIKDTLGLNLLAADYFNTINTSENFDTKVYKNKLIFQTDNWHQIGTTKFNYEKIDFYQENNPNEIFSSSFLYSDLDNPEKDKQIKLLAKHADGEVYNEEIGLLTEGNPIWSTGTPNQLPPNLEDNDVAKYQKSLERFKWWLRFRYQQYYYSQILPQLNETLFTMSHMLSSILRITNTSNTPKIQIDNSTYATQLQDWGSDSTWSSKFRLVWEYTTSVDNAQVLESTWTEATPSLPELITNDTINPAFLTTLAASDQTIKNTVDPVLGLNAYVSDTSSKDYNSAVTDKENNVSGWRINKANNGSHYWSKDGNGSFVYSAPVYWIDVVQNLDFNYYRSLNTSLVIDKDDNYKNLKNYWNNSHNWATSNSNFSKYMRGPEVTSKSDPNYNYYQNMKWNTFWQMMYFIASQADSNPNKSVATENFTTAAKALYPNFIRKENIYNIDFWNAVKEYY